MSLYDDLTEILTPYADKINQNTASLNDLRDDLDNLDVSTDTTLTQSGMAADAKTVGDSISETETAMDALERRVDGITTYGHEEMFNGVFANYARNVGTGKIYESELMRSTNFISAENGATYKISVSGSFNRLSIYGCYGNTVGVNADSVHFEEGNFTEKEYTFVNSNNYPYFFVLLAYNYSSFSASLSIIRSFGDNTNGFSVNGVRVYTAEETDELVDGASDGIGERILGITDSNYRISVEESYLTGKGIQNNIIKTASGYYIAYFENIAGTKVDIAVSGGYNRFGVYYGDSLDVNTELTRLTLTTYSTNIQREDSYTIENSENRRYILIFYSYNTVGDVEFNISIQNYNNEFTVNGVRVYTAEEIGSLQRYNGYISGAKIQTVNTVAELYALYDALVTSYPYTISKTVLGQGTGTLDMVEYVVTLGNYNAYTTNRRNEDLAIIKPVILILTGCHGYERSSIMGVYQFVKDMLDGNVIASEVLAKFTFKIIPCGCPYSFDNNQRINANNVNIERNFDTAIWTYQGEGTFDYGGAAAADQPETVIIQDWIDANSNAVLLIDFHNSGYLDEVSFLYGDNSYAGVASLKELYLKAIHERIPYFIHEEGYANTLLYAYTGSGFNNISTAYRYAIENNVLAVCLECSYNINSTGLNSAQTNKTNAEVLGTILTHYANE